MMVADGLGIFSATMPSLVSALARAALFVFLKDPSGVAKDHGMGPRGCHDFLEIKLTALSSKNHVGEQLSVSLKDFLLAICLCHTFLFGQVGESFQFLFLAGSP